MPTYEFYCEKCGKEREIFLKKIIEDNHEEICECGYTMVKELFAPIGFTHVDKGTLCFGKVDNYSKKLRNEKKDS